MFPKTTIARSTGITFLAGALLLTGCAGGPLSTREKGAGVGALGGAAAGGIVGAAVGHPGAGAAIGGALGLGAGAGAVLLILSAFLLGGVYTITPPSGPVDTAYKMNRFTGRVWLIKTYSKPMAQVQVRVLTAREAEVEKTRDLKDEDLDSFAMNQPAAPVPATRRR